MMITASRRKQRVFFREFLQYQPEDYTGMGVSQLQDLLSFRCSDQDSQNLVQPVTPQEIKDVLFAMPSNKSPGPDRFNAEFYKATWDIIGPEFVIAVQAFFVKRFLPKGVNSTILALIPKTTEATEMKDYRPISCCNVLYKFISKLITNRLKRLLPQFISANQSAFVSERLLIENLLLATEIVKDYHKDNISSRCAIKIDISKAFDSVQWPFLLNTLSAMNFPHKFIHCISTPSFSVQVDGELSGYFQSKRGLRQGCSLSPYLFVIVMDVLSKLLDKAAHAQNFGYHPRFKGLSLTHDLMVVTDGKVRSVEGIVDVFDKFAKYSGSRISMGGVTEDIQMELENKFHFKTDQLLVRYLGLPPLFKNAAA